MNIIMMTKTPQEILQNFNERRNSCAKIDNLPTKTISLALTVQSLTVVSSYNFSCKICPIVISICVLL